MARRRRLIFFPYSKAQLIPNRGHQIPETNSLLSSGKRDGEHCGSVRPRILLFISSCMYMAVVVQSFGSEAARFFERNVLLECTRERYWYICKVGDVTNVQTGR